MAIKTFRPLTHSLRHTRLVDFVELTESKPLKQLTRGKNKTGARNNRGRQTVA
ncbi:MAG TPA: 50S ribosomal protein L2, partial [Planctomycetota bacterium]|nr:50S ribosomal protein L2 [Planctomycetota bacterium]